jgi:hypothetical protein
MEVVKKRGKNWQEIKKECRKKDETGNFSSINPCKMEMMLGGGDE